MLVARDGEAERTEVVQMAFNCDSVKGIEEALPGPGTRVKGKLQVNQFCLRTILTLRCKASEA